MNLHNTESDKGGRSIGVFGEIPSFRRYETKLNPYSQVLLKYIKKAPDLKNRPRFSQQSKKFLSKILKHIKEGETQFRKQPLSQIEPSNYKTSDLYSSIPKQIKTIIESQPTKQESYEFSINNRNFRVQFIIPTNKPQQPNEIQTALKLTYIWFYVASQYTTNPKCASSLQLYIYLIPHRKVLPTIPNQPIEEIHANTAFTWACVENSTIQIFREEEWFKVLIHETFHTMGLDFSTMDVRKCQQKITELFSIKTEGLLFESYCETWATILNCLFLGYFSETITTKILATTENLITLETKYAIFQSIKVLKHYGLSYSDIVYKTSDSIQKRRPDVAGSVANGHRRDDTRSSEATWRIEQYVEKTNVFCYNVLKALMLYYLDDFLVWCDTNNSGSLEFLKTPKMIENFCEWIETHYKTKAYIEDYSNLQRHFQGSQKSHETKYIFDSMRMTIFG